MTESTLKEVETLLGNANGLITSIHARLNVLDEYVKNVEQDAKKIKITEEVLRKEKFLTFSEIEKCCVTEELFQDMVENPIIKFQCLYRQWKCKEKNIIKIQAICRRWLASRELHCCNPSCSWRKFSRTRMIPPEWFYRFKKGKNSVPCPMNARYTDHEIHQWWKDELEEEEKEEWTDQYGLCDMFRVDGLFCLDCQMKYEFVDYLNEMSDEFCKIGVNGLPVGINLTPRQTGLLKLTINTVLGATYTGYVGRPYASGFMLEAINFHLMAQLKIYGISKHDWHRTIVPWISTYICPGRPSRINFSHNEIMMNPRSLSCQQTLDHAFIGTQSLVNVDWALEGSLPGIMSLISYS